jgi:hypothetical protein
MTEREQFEAWHRNRWPTVDLDGLASHQVHARGEAWQARAALSQQAVRLLERVVSEVGRTITPELRAAIDAYLAKAKC